MNQLKTVQFDWSKVLILQLNDKVAKLNGPKLCYQTEPDIDFVTGNWKDSIKIKPDFDSSGKKLI